MDKYIVVEGKDIKKIVKKTKLDFKESEDNITSIDGEELFNKYNIKKEYQKIILNLSSFDFFSKNNSKEFLTDLPFSLEGEKTKDKIIVQGSYENFNTEEDTFIRETILVSTNLEYISYDEVVKFYKELKDKDLLNHYASFLKELFNLNHVLIKEEKIIR